LPVLTFGLIFLFLNWHCSPLVNVREDQSTAHALMFARGHHGAALIALDHRLVTRRTTSVTFVDFGIRPEKYVFCG
jgi:elongation factor P hydroxylase